MAIDTTDSPDMLYVLAMGGTIDKDYPRLTSGYAFEFGDEPAASRILNSHPNLGVSPHITSICKRDSLEITAADRQALLAAIKEILCHRNNSARILVTHGTDTMIETALYIKKHLHEEKLGDCGYIAFTGATKPERFVDSDASFNVGSAVTATSAIQLGSVVICMNGNMIPAERCIRDEKTGLFNWKPAA